MVNSSKADRNCYEISKSSFNCIYKPTIRKGLERCALPRSATSISVNTSRAAERRGMVPGIMQGGRYARLSATWTGFSRFGIS